MLFSHGMFVDLLFFACFLRISYLELFFLLLVTVMFLQSLMGCEIMVLF